MASLSLRAAIAVGALQGVLEWLPVSSEGNVTLLLTVVFGFPAIDAVGLSLFLHAGTAMAAAVYYRDTLVGMGRAVTGRRSPTAADRSARGGPGERSGRSERAGGPDRRAEATFLAVATLVSGCAGVAAYATLESVVSAFSGGGFVALVGILLILTGLFQYRVGDGALDRRDEPRLRDAVLVGAVQGLAVLPGVSRSGVTTGTLLLRGYGGTDAFRLSFLLSIPAALGAGTLAVVEAGGLPSIAPAPAGAALATSAVVGLATIGALLRVVEWVTFRAVCLGLGVVSLVGAGLFLL